MKIARENPGKTLNNYTHHLAENRMRSIDIFYFVPIIPMP
jgi:hypothetical protein